MLFINVSAFLFIALAGRVLAQAPAAVLAPEDIPKAAPGQLLPAGEGNFTLAVGKYPAVQPFQLLNIPNSLALQNCQAQCDETVSIFNACVPNDVGCFCQGTTLSSLARCEQCMFTDMIARNARPAVGEWREGSNPAVGAYVGACNAANVTIGGVISPNFIKLNVSLALPATWDGPTGIDLGLPFTVIGVMSSTAMVIGFIVILSSL